MSVLPNHFTDKEVKTITDLVIINNYSQVLTIDEINPLLNDKQVVQYNLTLGLVIKLRSVIERLFDRTNLQKYRSIIDIKSVLYVITYIYTIQEDRNNLLANWNETALYEVSDELIAKSNHLSPVLSKELALLPLVRCHSAYTYITYKTQFLSKVKQYHETVARPEGTFTSDKVDEDSYIIELSKVSRSICSLCNAKRQLYCGDCGGVRLPSTEHLLPHRVELPFDILLIVHWHETLHKCTGMYIYISVYLCVYH